MKMPWSDKEGLAKAVVLFACIFGVSLGLCGVNWAILSTPASKATFAVLPLLVGVAGAVGIVGSVLGLLIVALMGLFQGLFRRSKDKQ